LDSSFYNPIAADKFAAWGGTLDDVLETTSRHTDIVNLGLNMKWKDEERILDRWAPLVQQPFFDADSTFAAPPSENVPNPMGSPRTPLLRMCRYRTPHSPAS